ncbi:MAG TPA: hypothetical protein EYN79_08615 [Planctomycetes bacterium]|nr:hypothetical protein [Planctomycetota bacterium]HIN80836.1 hypothetical protein [Planctomycetota bacterium]
MRRGSAVAIDPGKDRIRAVWVRSGGHSLKIERAIEVDGPGDEESIGELVLELSRNGVPISLGLGLNGEMAALRYNLLPPVPDWRLEMILKYELEEIAEKSGEPLSSDFMELSFPDSMTDEMVLLVGLGKESKIAPVVSRVAEAKGRVRLALPLALGAYHCFLACADHNDQETVLIVDVGHRESHILIVREDRLLFARAVTFGGADLDKLISDRVKLSSEEARIRKETLSSGGSVRDQESVEGCMRAWLNQLSQMLRSSVSFCQVQTKLPELTIDRALIAGGSAPAVLSSVVVPEAIGCPVEEFLPSIGGEALPGRASAWVGAIGVAAAQLDEKNRILDVLPEAEKKQREFKERTIFLWLAAAALLLSLLLRFGDVMITGNRVEEAVTVSSHWRQKINGWKAAEAEAKVANDVFRKREARLRVEIESSRFFSSVYDELRVALPASVAINKIESIRVELEGEVGIEVELQGSSDNSERMGLDHITSLQNALKEIPGVIRVEVDPGDLKNGSYPFVMRVSPDQKLPQAKRGSRRSPGRG